MECVTDLFVTYDNTNDQASDGRSCSSSSSSRQQQGDHRSECLGVEGAELL